METIGWLGAIFLAVCGLPQAVLAWRTGNTGGISRPFIFLWTMGEVFGLAYVIYLGNWPLITNYLANTLACLVICRYTLWPRIKY